MTNEASRTSSIAHESMTELELREFERETVAKLAEALPLWYQTLGPGLDPVFAGLVELLKVLDDEATSMGRSGATELEIRSAAARTLASNLAVPKPPHARSHQKTVRLKVLGAQQKARSDMAYEAQTIALIANDFPAWYDEVGFSGFLSSLLELVKAFTEVFHEYLEDESVARDEVFFLTAYEMRRRLSKLPLDSYEAAALISEVESKESENA